MSNLQSYLYFLREDICIRKYNFLLLDQMVVGEFQKDFW